MRELPMVGPAMQTARADLVWPGLLALLVAVGDGSRASAATGELPPRYRAPIVVAQPAPFVHLPLAPAVYAHSLSPGLADLRVLDARGERVPFALLAPRPEETETLYQWREVTLYRLPPRPPTGDWAAPVDLTIEGGRVSVRRRGAPPVPPEHSPGWLVDLGAPLQDDAAGQTAEQGAQRAAAPQILRFEWSAPAEFSAPYLLEMSADLRTWRAAGSGQLVALAAAAGALTQPEVLLPGSLERFARVVWRPGATPPELRAAYAGWPSERRTVLDPPTPLVLSASAEPDGAHAGDDARRAVHFDLGATLPVATLDLRLPRGTRVLPVRVQARTRLEERWQTIAGTVLYRIEREHDGVPATDRSPPVVLGRSVRFLRIVADARAAMPAAAEVQLEVRANLASVVFAAQGEAPYALLAGAAGASPGALPLATLMPEAEKERARFGTATLGAFAEDPEAAQQAAADARRLALRPWLLWAVLLAGVGVLATMVWRLARARSSASASND